MRFLGIESSCDDTSVAIVEDGHTILANVVTNQDDYHGRYGGVVPEIAARKHLEHILPAVQHCLDISQCRIDDITAIAVTYRPGLVGSLIIGLTAAKSLAFLYKKPLIGINHLEAHVYTCCFAGMTYGTPHIALVASGGHTSILQINSHDIHLIGRTVDDAVGEAYDKIAKFMGLGYPGGPILDRLAQTGDPATTRFPRPMIDQDNYNFSFSGLKTAVMYFLHHYPDTPPPDIAASFQDAVIDVLTTKTIQAAISIGYKTIGVAGGVASNSGLRKLFTKRCEERQIQLFIPPPRLCTDNAAMVAGLAYHKWLSGCISDLTLGVHADFGLKMQSRL